MASFSADVDAWVRKTKIRQRAVVRESAQRVVSEMLKPRGAGGRMPIDTGFLRASARASRSAMPTIDSGATPASGQTYAARDSDITLEIARMDVGDVLYVGFTAAYAAAQEYGARGRTPAAFVRGASEQWQSIVAQVAVEARSRAGG